MKAVGKDARVGIIPGRPRARAYRAPQLDRDLLRVFSRITGGLKRLQRQPGRRLVVKAARGSAAQESGDDVGGRRIEFRYRITARRPGSIAFRSCFPDRKPGGVRRRTRASLRDLRLIVLTCRDSGQKGGDQSTFFVGVTRDSDAQVNAYGFSSRL